MLMTQNASYVNTVRKQNIIRNHATCCACSPSYDTDNNKLQTTDVAKIKGVAGNNGMAGKARATGQDLKHCDS